MSYSSSAPPPEPGSSNSSSTVTIPASLLETLLQGNVALTQSLLAKHKAGLLLPKHKPTSSVVVDRYDTASCYSLDDNDAAGSLSSFGISFVAMLLLALLIAVVIGPLLQRLLLYPAGGLRTVGGGGVCPVTGGLRPPGLPSFMFRSASPPSAAGP